MAHDPLLTDLYELTMGAAYQAAGRAETPATFSLYVRSLPASRGYIVAAGLDDALAYLEGLRFGDDHLAALEALDLLPGAFLARLAGLAFTGSVRAVPEGRVVLAGEPLLEVDAPLVEAQLVETALLNLVTYQSAVTSKAVRLREAAGGRPVADFGLRSAYGPEAGMRLARCARIAGLGSTSNVAGAAAYGLPASGTMAHAFVQVHDHEDEAFTAYARVFGERTVLLVDTYDAPEGIRRAVEVARRCHDEGRGVAALRIDSGNLDALSRYARAQLDGAGLTGVRIVVTGGLDERSIGRLVGAGAPVDGFGVGAALAVPGDAPALETTYKLVEVDGRPVRKLSPGKVTWAGAKQVWRLGSGRGDVLGLRREAAPEPGADPLLHPVMEAGRRIRLPDRTDPCDPAEAAHRLDADLAALPEMARRLDDPRPPAAVPSAGLVELTRQLDAAGEEWALTET